jgi:outer membrane protein TolC
LARESYEALQAGYKTAERNVEDTKKSFEMGLVSEYDKLTADVQLASIKPNLLAAQNGIKLAEMQLKVLMGVDVDEPLRFTGRLEDYEEGLFADLMNLKADTDLSDNSTIRQLDYNTRILRMSEKLNKLGYLPTLALALSAGYTAMPQEFNPFKATYFGSSTLSLSFSWTIFDGLQKYMKTKQNKLTIENLEQQRENALRQLELSVAASLNSIETAAEQVVSNKENVYAAERAFMISEKRYEVGSGTQLERNSSESNLLQARLQYVQSIYDFLSNRAALEKTLGKLVTD